MATQGVKAAAMVGQKLYISLLYPYSAWHCRDERMKVSVCESPRLSRVSGSRSGQFRGWKVSLGRDRLGF